VLCVANMGTAPSPRVNGQLLVASGEVRDGTVRDGSAHDGSAHNGSAHDGTVPPDTTAWFAVE